jgi:hypothetical protein
MAGSLWESLGKARTLQNIEQLDEYTVHLAKMGQRVGVSAMLRVKSNLHHQKSGFVPLESL